MVTSRELAELDAAALLRRGIAAARVGDGDEARACLTEVTRREPENADAWLWLASVEAHPQRKRDHFQRVLALRPGDAEAAAGLEQLAERFGAAVLLPDDADEAPHCTWHPDRETRLRCARCGRPMCGDCARHHPVGMRCKECAKALRSPLYRVGPLQYAGGFAVGFVAAFGAALLLGALWLMFALFGALAIGAPLGDAVSWGAGRKRGRGLQVVAAVSLSLGALAAIAAMASPLRGLPPLSLLPFSPLGPMALIVLGVATAVRRLK